MDDACSFCGRRASQVEQFVTGPGARICDQCVELAQSIIEESRVTGASPARPVHRPVTIHRLPEEEGGAIRDRDVLVESQFAAPEFFATMVARAPQRDRIPDTAAQLAAARAGDEQALHQYLQAHMLAIAALCTTLRPLGMTEMAAIQEGMPIAIAVVRDTSEEPLSYLATHLERLLNVPDSDLDSANPSYRTLIVNDNGLLDWGSKPFPPEYSRGIREISRYFRHIGVRQQE